MQRQMEIEALEAEGVRAVEEGGNPQLAVELFSRAIDMDDSRASAYNNRAQAYRLLANVQGKCQYTMSHTHTRTHTHARTYTESQKKGDKVTHIQTATHPYATKCDHKQKRKYIHTYCIVLYLSIYIALLTAWAFQKSEALPTTALMLCWS